MPHILPQQLRTVELLLDVKTHEGDRFTAADLTASIGALPWEDFFKALQYVTSLRVLCVSLRWMTPMGLVSWDDERIKLVSNHASWLARTSMTHTPENNHMTDITDHLENVSLEFVTASEYDSLFGLRIPLDIVY